VRSGFNKKSKKTNTMKKTILALALAAGLTSFAGNAKAQLLTINVSNPSAVTFTSTGNFASTSMAYSATQNLDFGNFFKSPLSFNVSGTGNLYGDGGSSAFLSTLNGLGLDLYLKSPTSYSGTFSTSSAAFTGTETFNLSGQLSYLPTAGTTGAIYGSSGPIGTYQVVSAVPEPSTYALFGLGAIGLLMVLRRKKAA